MSKKKIFYFLAFFLIVTLGGVIYYVYTLANNQEFLQTKFRQTIKNFFPPHIADKFTPPKNINFDFREKILTIQDIHVRDLQNNTFVSIAELQIKLSSLVQQKISSVVIKKPQVFIRKQNDKYNYHYLVENYITPPKTGDKPSADKLPDIHVYGGEVSYNDPKIFTQQISCSQLNIAANSVDNKYNFTLDAACNFLTSKLNVKGEFADVTSVKSADIKLKLDDLHNKLVSWPRELDVAGDISLKNISFNSKKGFQAQFLTNCSSIYWRDGVLDSYPLTNLSIRSPISNKGFENIDLQCVFLKERITGNNGSWGVNGGRLFLTTQDISVTNAWLGKYQHLHPMIKEIKEVGKINASMKNSFELKQEKQKFSWKMLCSIDKGSFVYRNKKPTTIDNIRFQVQIDDTAATIHQGEWRFCNGTCRFDPYGKILWEDQRLKDVNIELDNVHLTRQFWDSIPFGDEIWQFSQAEGKVSGRVTFPEKFDPSISRNLSFPVHYIPKIDVYVKDASVTIWEAPVPVKNAQGNVVFENGILYLNNLTCNTRDYGGSGLVNGKIWLAVKPYPCLKLDIKCKQCEVRPGIYELFNNNKPFLGRLREWHKIVARVWEEISPKGGKVDVEVIVDKKLGTGTLDPEALVRVETFDTQIAYKNFYYPVKNVNGVVVVDIKQEKQRVDIKNFTARNAEGSFFIEGLLIPQKIDDEFKIALDLEVKGNNALLNNDLRDALDKNSKDIWQQLSPQGQIDAIVKVHKSAYKEDVEWQADIELNQVTVSHKKFCYPVREIMGDARISPGKFRLNASGLSVNDSQINIEGLVENDRYSFSTMVKDFPIEKKVFDYIPGGKDIHDLFRLKGKINLEIDIRGKQKKMDWQAKVTLNHMTGYYKKFPYHFDDVYGTVLVNPKEVKIENCYLRRKQMTARLQGIVKSDDYQLSISGNQVIVDKHLQRCYPEDVKKSLVDFKMKGIVDFQLIIRPGQTPFHLVVFPKNLDFIYKDFPYHLKNLRSAANAPIEVDINTVKLRNIVSKTKHGNIAIDGVIDILQDGKTIVDLKCRAENLQMDQLLYTALRPYLKEILTTLKPKGTVKNIDFALFYKEEKKQPYFRYRVDNLNIDSVMAEDAFLRQLSGNFSCSGFTFNGKNTMNGKCRSGSIKLDSVSLQDLNADIKFFNRYLSLKPKAKMYDGNIQGEILMDTSSYGGYKGSFSIDKVSLAKLVRDVKQEKKVDVSGLLSGFFKFEGTSYNSEQLTGSGKIDVKDGNLWEFPIFLAIFDLFALPSKPSFREGSMKFSFSPKTIQILSLQLSSSLLSISGSGSIKNGQCNIRLRTNLTPRIIPRIPLVTDVLDYVKDGVLGLSLTGTVQNPRVSFLHWKEFQKMISGSKDK
ncbi:hypothetical protein [Candidatus Uabimicrobium amorphum]|uniref:AsmA-like C-terminal domain-containing protein n=1 Tax=Uabimicrobium amorphum TaxID=2596890 RepID=A0A5S9IN54_UABAM|nr:hypothetical protein [Candidatus Uabimicrobium amorphum]BBM84120.1 hypothetical protein UABAM_02476 [Candidatus Uabimicrobium amorphum]